MAARAGGLSDPIYALPLARLIVNGWWQWSLLLLGATAFAGITRALPLLAARRPSPPLRLWRVLSALGIVALLARAALYLLAWGEAWPSDGTTGAELFVGGPLAVLGVALCLLAAFWCVRRPGYSKLGLAIVLALFAPQLLQIALAPLGLIVPTPPTIEARNRAQTRAAWNLDALPVLATQAPPLASHWPIWNEEALLGMTRGEFARNPQHVIDWRQATIAPAEAIVAGVPAGLENWGSPHEADAPNALEWLAFDPTRSADGRAPALPNAPLPLTSFYGIAGRPLLGDAAQSAGAPFRFWGWKFAWAWRLRDPLLMLEGARASTLLVFRGARETAEILAPFLTWDEAQLQMTPVGPRWQLVGYAATPYYRGARALDEGAFAGQNAVQPVALLQVNPRDGRAEFRALPGARWSAPWTQVLRAAPSAVGAAPALPLWESARARLARQIDAPLVLAEPVWTWADGRAGWRQVAARWPAGVEERLALLDASARREWDRGEASLQTGGALLWPDARAPGGFWVGRPYYATTIAAGVASAGGIARSAKLWRVSLTGIAPSPVASGDDARAALVAFDLQTAPTTPAAGADKQLLLQALRAHDAAQKAASASNWGEWAKQSAHERKLLEGLTARATAERGENSRPNATRPIP